MEKSKCPHPRLNLYGDERLSRFLFEEKHFDSQQAFKPPANLKFSVFRTSKSSEASIWHIGDTFVAAPIGRPILGRADLAAQIYSDHKLQFEPNGKPQTRHTNILGWNSDKPQDLEKRAALALAATWIRR